MFDYKQRATTSEYRDNWERIYGEKPIHIDFDEEERELVDLSMADIEKTGDSDAVSSS